MKTFLLVIDKLLPLISIIISALVSYFVAGLKTKSEMKKIKLTFAHEDSITLNNAFSKLMEKTQYYCEATNQLSRNEAVKAVAEYTYLAHEKIKPSLKELDAALFNKDIEAIKKLRQTIFDLHLKCIKNPR